MRFEMQLSVNRLSAIHPNGANGRTVYAAVTVGRTFYIQRWARMDGMKPQHTRVACPLDGRMVWGWGSR